jgi:hypothetical protein
MCLYSQKSPHYFLYTFIISQSRFSSDFIFAIIFHIWERMHMGDIFKEQLVKRKPSALHKLCRAGLVLGVVAAFVLGEMLVPGWGITIALIAGFVAYFLNNRLNLEYEYTLTNGELDIDIIYNKASRKRVFSGIVKDFDLMAHVEDTTRAHDFDNAMATVDYSGGETTPNTYAFLAAYKGKRLKVIFEPNDMMLKAISTTLTPRKLFRKV